SALLGRTESTPLSHRKRGFSFRHRKANHGGKMSKVPAFPGEPGTGASRREGTLTRTQAPWPPCSGQEHSCTCLRDLLTSTPRPKTVKIYRSMRILHTADWHLGDRLGRIDRTEDLQKAVERIGALCLGHQVDLLLIAGDLFSELSRPDGLRASIEHL